MGAVSRVYGVINGVQVDFTPDPNEPDRYKVDGVPVKKDGIYVMEIYAEDIAGNIGFLSKIYVAIREGRIVNDRYTTSLREDNTLKRGGILNASKIERTLSD